MTNKEEYIQEAELWANDEGNSACEIWMSKDNLAKLGKMINDNSHEIKSICVDTKDEPEGVSTAINDMLSQGFEEFDREENFQTTEMIFIKKL